jgi:hypothetical protein
MQKVQVVSLKFVKDSDFLKEQYESLGFIAKYEGEDLVLYWGKPKRIKPKEDDEEKRPERRSKTERRLGKKFSHGDA